jgi:hypothetical protein
MAEMIPESITYFPNARDGEKSFFDILKDALKPDDEYIAWYEPEIKDRFNDNLKPDFIIWGQNSGLSIIEIKDWSLEYFQGSNITKDEIILKCGKRLKNPEKQALDYMYNTMDNLQRHPCFVNSSGPNSGKLRFPFGYGVVLPNMTRNELENNFNSVINVKRTLTADELLKIETGDKIILKSFLKRIQKTHFTFKFLNLEELKTLRSVLSPGVEPPKTSADKNRENIVKILDREQEKEAYRIGPGHRVIRGVAGSGKTLLIAYRAKILKMLYPNWKILIICYNITLRNYIKKFLLKNINLGTTVDTDIIEVYHFHDFISEKYNIYTPEQKDDWVKLQTELSKIINKKIDNGEITGDIYDAILVDECQDLVTDYIKLLVHLLKKETNHLLISIDPEQNIYNYGSKISWNSLGIQARGRSKSFNKSYRCSYEILQFAKKFNPGGEQEENGDINSPLFPEFNERHDEKPIIKQFEDDSSIVNYIISEIIKVKTERNLQFSEIGILFTKKKTFYNNQTKRGQPFSYYNSLLQGLKISNIPFKEIEVRNDKLNFNFESNEIKIITIHSVKGYEFKVVFLINLENEWKYDDLTRSLIYVGITRAQDLLYIPYLRNGKHLKYIREMENAIKNIPSESIE